MSTELRQALDKVARRFRRLRLWRGLALCWLAWSILALLLYLASSRPGYEWLTGQERLVSLAMLAAATGIVCSLFASRAARDPRWVARRIEAKHPELAAALLAAVEQNVEDPSGQLGFLQTAVIRQALEHGRRNDWNRAVPTRTMGLSQLAHAAALGLLLLAAAALAGQVYTRASDRAKPVPAAQAFDVEVEPGSTEIERGTSLLVVAHFKGTVPERVSMAIEGLPQGQTKQAMTRSLEDPMFAGRVESVDADLSYRVEFDGQSTETYHVKVYETPELERTDAALVFPPYTGLVAKTIEDIRHVTAVEGTELTLLCRLNKDVTTARLIDEKGAATALSPKGSGGHVYQAAFTLADSHRYRVELIDADGRRNKQKTEIMVNVTRNKPAVVTMTQPAHDVRVSPVEELKLKAQLEDDFGVVRQGLAFTPAGQEPREIVFKNPEKLPHKATAEYLLDFESLQAVPDQLVTYYFWAEDIGPDGKPRRTDGDMFFAEVRPFEEIFRQGEQPPSGSAQNEGQQGQNAQQADRLAELQKQIISATWTLIRRETDGKPSSKFVEDAKVIRDSQHAAIEQAAELGGRLRDAKSKAELEKATQLMNDAEKRLTEAADGPGLAALRPALAAEQAAYQALLKLRAREFQVIRNNSRQRQGGAAGGSPSQQQLDQLELSDDENRFEQQRSARADQNRLSRREQEQREARQVLNRLRELAQRQSDLNSRLKELQSALEAAKNEEARKEIERQLKRLREQEEQILRDADELRQRMEQEENRQRMEQARQQMEESRQHVREASKALEEGRLSKAITEGARAGQQLNDLRDQVRKETSDRFSTEMTEMRKEARQLDENQKKVTDQLDAWNQNPRQTLRDTEERKGLRTGLEQQEVKLDKLLERMRQTVQEAEETEPLLAKSLFDTARKADEQKIPDTLKVTRRLLDAGITDDAAKASQRAGQGIDELKKGVERAAERILGDETTALRRAQGEVDDLGDQVDREIAQATGRNPRERRPGADGAVDPFDHVEMLGTDTKAQQPRSPRRGAEQRKGSRSDPNRPSTKGQPARQGDQRGQQGEQAGQQQEQAGQQQEQAGQQASGGQGDASKSQQQGGQRRQGQGLRGPGQQNQPGEGQPSENQPNADGQPQGGQGQNQNQSRGAAGGGRRQGGGANQPSGLDRLLEGPARGPGGPVTGEGFRQWSDRMRDVEELLDDPELRGQAARIRDRVRGAREEFKRHAKVPDWNQLQSLVADPLRELGQRIAEEVRRRESPDSLVPIDRDPVPPQFAEGVRRYYERLGERPMTEPSIIWGSPGWMTPALILMGVGAMALLWSYARASASFGSGASRGVRTLCALLKGVALALLTISLVEPLLTGTRPRPGANAMVILADNSQSLQIRDGQDSLTRGDWLRGLLAGESAWKTRLGQDFDVRQYAFDSHLRAVDRFDALSFDGTASSLSASLGALTKRFRGLPLAGIMLVTDGNTTDGADMDWSSLPPVYTVSPPSRDVARDISVRQVSTSQTSFESAPVVVQAEVVAVGYAGRKIVTTLIDESGKEVERRDAMATADGKPLNFRFQFRPEKKGVSFYRALARAADEEKNAEGQDPTATSEQTLANNSRLVVIDQGSGPYRVLYVSGRPNWEFKFLRRAVAEDEQVQLVGLVRIATKQPKFDFRSRRTQTSALFEGFDHPDAETAEQHDQPVLVRLNTLDEVELRDGFPKTSEDLFKYHAVVLDDLEAGFFNQDQLALVRNFVSQRGGGLLMLGGPDTFAEGKYDRTPVGELMPVYLNPPGPGLEPAPDLGNQEYQLVLTREGWLQPWVRLRATEDEEQTRMAAMPAFRTLNHVGKAKPGAVVLAEVRDPAGNLAPALVAQQFGKGHVGALLIGDLWRWGLRRENPTESDLGKSWRQTVRWLVGDVPNRVEVSVAPKADATAPTVELTVRVRDPAYQPLDNAKIALKLKLPDGTDLGLDAEADGREAGVYSARYVAKQPGAYRVRATATAPDGSAIGEREAGWVAQPAADEFARLEPNRELLRTIATKTKGELVESKDLEKFVAGLFSRKAPITESWTSPLWHRPLYFLIAIVCLTAEWGLRRVNGLA